MKPKPYVFRCELCRAVLQSVSLSGFMALMRRHRKKHHADHDGPIEFRRLGLPMEHQYLPSFPRYVQ